MGGTLGAQGTGEALNFGAAFAVAQALMDADLAAKVKAWKAQNACPGTCPFMDCWLDTPVITPPSPQDWQPKPLAIFDSQMGYSVTLVESVGIHAQCYVTHKKYIDGASHRIGEEAKQELLSQPKRPLKPKPTKKKKGIHHL
jgi:hypothetical protein